MTDNNTG